MWGCAPDRRFEKDGICSGPDAKYIHSQSCIKYIIRITKCTLESLTKPDIGKTTTGLRKSRNKSVWQQKSKNSRKNCKKYPEENGRNSKRDDSTQEEGSGNFFLRPQHVNISTVETMSEQTDRYRQPWENGDNTEENEQT